VTTGPRPDPPSRSCKVVVTGLAGTAQWTNVLWLYLTGSGEITHTTLIALANGIYGQWGGTILDAMSTSATISRVQVVLWDGGEEFSAYSTSASAAGNVGGTMAPANVAACISWPISFHYRGGHPRTYIAGVPNSAIATSQRFDATWRASLETKARAFHTAVEALTPGGGIATVEHGIMSFVTDKEWRTPPVFRRITGDAQVDSRIDTQRRRLGPDLSA